MPNLFDYWEDPTASAAWPLDCPEPRRSPELPDILRAMQVRYAAVNSRMSRTAVCQANQFHAPSSPPEHLDVEVFDAAAQRVAVDAEQFGGADLVTARGSEGG
jgi:hypothetical protein